MICDGVHAGATSYIPELNRGVPGPSYQTPGQLWVESDTSYIIGMAFEYLDSLPRVLVPHANGLVIRARGKDVSELGIEDHVKDSLLMALEDFEGFRTSIHVAEVDIAVHATNYVLISR